MFLYCLFAWESFRLYWQHSWEVLLVSFRFGIFLGLSSIGSSLVSPCLFPYFFLTLLLIMVTLACLSSLTLYIYHDMHPRSLKYYQHPRDPALARGFSQTAGIDFHDSSYCLYKMTSSHLQVWVYVQERDRTEYSVEKTSDSYTQYILHASL
jgi:hypothetical protein